MVHLLIRHEGLQPLHGGGSPKGPKYLYIVECRVSILGITIMIWDGIPHNSTLDPKGSAILQGSSRSAEQDATCSTNTNLHQLFPCLFPLASRSL